jgi:hypothetical protein
MIHVRGLFIVLVCSGVLTAGEAVSELNGKLAYSAGSMEGDTGQNVLGSISFPIAANFGFQADGLYTHVSDRDFYGAGAHLFWRDWDKGLLGIVGAGLWEDEIRAGLFGVEAEYYLNRFTLAAGLGVATIDYGDSAPFIDTDVTDFYASLGLRYYPLDDLMLSASYLHVFDNNLVLGGLEYQTPIRGLSLFAEVARGEHGYDHALLGLQIYFGRTKSLVRRHREDDPQNIVQRALYAVGTYGAEFNRRHRKYAQAQGIEYTGGSYGVTLTMPSPSQPLTPEEFLAWLEEQDGSSEDSP